MSHQPTDRWTIAIDRGGTFTDIVAHRGNEVRHTKVLSRQERGGEDASLGGIRQLIDWPSETPLGPDVLESLRLGTTVATNALLTRTGEPTTLVVTEGFRDLPWIGDQSRPDLVTLDIARPKPIAAAVIEARERVSVDGEVIRPLDEDAIRDELRSARSLGHSAVAIVLLHGWQHDVHEQRVADIAKEVGFENVVTSQTNPMRGLVSRFDTVSLDASLTPVLLATVTNIEHSIGGVPLLCMQSSGGLVATSEFRGSRAVLSGPAGGLVGAAQAARAEGMDRIVAIDMGGTSTDVSWYGGELERDTGTRLGGARIRTPMLRIHTVAAGGGSICRMQGGRLRVGPQSAGAYPGPASYRHGGPATLTDCQVVLGRLPISAVPSLFGDSGNLPIDGNAARESIQSIADAAGMSSAEEAAAGCLDVAVECVAAAIGRVTLEQGHDTTSASLCVFGGAGGGIACRVADRLGMDTVLIPPRAGVLSAVGIAGSDLIAVRRRSVECTLDPAGEEAMRRAIDEARREAIAELRAAGADADDARVMVALRAAGWDRSIPVALADPDQMDQCFREASRVRFGFEARGPLVIESVEVEAAYRTPCEWSSPAATRPADTQTTQSWIKGRWVDLPVLSETEVVDCVGPAIVLHDGATTVVEPGWTATRTERGAILIRRTAAAETMIFDAKDPGHIEILNRRFLSICRDMGTSLQHTATSVNIKERRDYSCAIFDRVGRLVANGPHIPVHLGSMGQSVQRVIEVHEGSMKCGDSFLINDPAQGGTHLPDLTVVSPVFDGDTVQFFIASRAHHADVGGITPGSMPPDSTTIDQEGVVFDAALLTRNNVLLLEEVQACLKRGPWPARQPDVVLDDLRAQLAANTRGSAQLRLMAEELGWSRLAAAMDAMRVNAAACVSESLRGETGGKAVMVMDDGGEIHVRIEITEQGRGTIDFSGTSSQRSGNTNAPRAVTRAAVLYVLRCLVNDDIPLNDGCFEPVELIIPEGSMLSPRPGAAVVGGNVETSQAIVDCLLAAFARQAASQGTMNNLTFGDGTRQYYETICGGAGAGIDFDGASGVHTHMTNSLLTDPEVLEARYPVRLEQFGFRIESGGAGEHRGGDGVIRVIRFMDSMQVSLLSNRRRAGAPGLSGGQAGLPGRQWLVFADGSRSRLDGCFSLHAAPDDVLHIETPGGGGWGQAGRM
ncbi:MAG: hydantoinase B/oxoprolinase family protein [Phycisphaerales bacterium]|nr:hydantoinase B/oxoprolinase family protein [Phycisphaerales bacterium]